jgi:aminomethyltransferase
LTRGLPGTPFHSRTAPLVEGQTWRRWAGYVVASSYELHHDREYHAIRSSAALFDVSPLFKYHVWADAVRLLIASSRDGLTQSRAGALHALVRRRGKVLDDGTVSVLSPDFLRLTSADPNYRWLCENARSESHGR